jgi:hypothetical protein
LSEEIYQIVKNKKEPNATKDTKENLSDTILSNKFWDSNSGAENIRIFTTKLAKFYEQKNILNLQQIYHQRMNLIGKGLETNPNTNKISPFNNQIPFNFIKDLTTKADEKAPLPNNYYSSQVFPSSPTSPRKKVKKGDEDHKVINLERVNNFKLIFRFLEKRTKEQL